MSYEETQSRVLSVVLWILYWASLAAAPILLLESRVPGSQWALLIGHPLVVVAILGERRGAPWVRPLLLGSMVAISSFTVPLGYIQERFNLAFFIIPLIALVVASGTWVLGASAAGYAVLLARSGLDPLYTDPMTLIIVSILVGGMAMARFLVDGAIRRAEDQAALLEEQAELLAQERAGLAQRVDERTSELRVANEALVRANRARNELLAIVSHELRTPLNIILGSVDLVEEEIYGPISDEQRRALQRMGASGRHLLSLIDDLLDVATLERGSFALDPVPVDPPALCRHVAELIAPTAQQKGLSFAQVVPDGLPAILGDERRLRQILLNLLTNAVKFTPSGGAVSLLAAHDEGGWVSFTVVDTGIGIAREDQAVIFAPFVQLDGGLSRSHEGAGLGLALAFRLAERHGGTLLVESETGRGSRFTVRLPCAPAAPPPA